MNEICDANILNVIWDWTLVINIYLLLGILGSLTMHKIKLPNSLNFWLIMYWTEIYFEAEIVFFVTKGLAKDQTISVFSLS